jgi:hypothetical protein
MKNCNLSNRITPQAQQSLRSFTNGSAENLGTKLLNGHVSAIEEPAIARRNPKRNCHNTRYKRQFLPSSASACGGGCFYLNRCLPKGRMSSLLLKSDTQITQARQAVQAYRQLLETLDQLSWINLELLRRGEPLSGEPSPV